MTAEGEVLRALDEAKLAAGLARLAARGIESIAIVFMHGYRHPAHERRAAAIARAAGFREVIASHEVSPLIRLVSRGDTTVVDAYLSPLLARYVREFRAGLGERHAGARLEFMQSNGGLAAPEEFRACNAVLSGPAGGLVATARIAEDSGRPRLIAFDMGGTSTDVALYDGALPQRFETSVAGVRLQAPMMNIHTVAAGGGSLLAFAGGRLTVGPGSAGSRPGPACYRNGGPLTVTDVQVLLGRIRPDAFPAMFGPRGDEPLDAGVVRQKFEALAGSTGDTAPDGVERLATGFLDVAVESMSRAIRHVSIREGHDPSEFALLCYGGAAPQHACRVADSLGIREILIHPLGRRALGARASALPTAGWCAARASRACSLPDCMRRSTPRSRRSHSRFARPCRPRVRNRATSARIARSSCARPARKPRSRSGTRRSPRCCAISARCSRGASDSRRPSPPRWSRRSPSRPWSRASTGSSPRSPGRTVAPTGASRRGSTAGARCRWSGVPRSVHAHRSAGPALIVEPNSTTVVEPGWSAATLADGTLRLARHEPRQVPAIDAGRPDPAQLELFNHRFMQVAEQMGAVLQATAVSVNIRERLDFSCALFDGAGALIANAPHMPVHLGSMGASVRAVIAANAGAVASRAGLDAERALRRRDAPAGHHGREPRLLRASAGNRHSSSPRARTTPTSAASRRARCRPPRTPSRRKASCSTTSCWWTAARSAKRRCANASPAGRGRRGTPTRTSPTSRHSSPPTRAAPPSSGRSSGARASTRSRATWSTSRTTPKPACAKSSAASVTASCATKWTTAAPSRSGSRSIARGRRATVDFAGTSPQQPGNFNAPLAVCTAAVLYVFRTLVDADFPLNEGCLRPISIRAARGSMVNPVPPAAVVAGNVETSQCIVDALFGALGVLAASQGTMNNLTFGDDVHQYYETIAGGSGAGPGFDGASGVQTHMTNSRLTDPEVLESRHPVLVREFRYRRGSGGSGT